MQVFHSKFHLFILFFYSLIDVNQCYFEVQLTRNQQYIELNTTEQLTGIEITKCPKVYSLLKHNTTFSPQICFKKDLTYNIKVMIGDYTFNYEIVDLAVDLSIPWSWIKTDDCHSCPAETHIPTYYDSKQLECNNLCINDKQNVTYLLPSIAMGKQQVINKHAVISSTSSLLYGQYISDQFSFVAYDNEKRRNFFHVLADEFENFDALEEVVILKQFKMLAVSKMIGYEDYTADGAIGLGFAEEENDDSAIESDTNFLNLLMENIDDQPQANQQEKMFGIYINDLGPYVKDHVMTIGGWNARYAREGSTDSDINWIPILIDTGYYWVVPIKEFQISVSSVDINNPSNNPNFNIIAFQNSFGVISLSTSFIALPLKELQQFIQVINKFGNSQCGIVDDDQYVVYCKNLSLYHVTELHFQINFKTDSQPVVIHGYSLIRQCSEKEDFALFSDRFDCTLNIQLSHDNKTILGEPFLKQHYTLFHQDKKRIGLLPASDNQFWGYKRQLHFGEFFKVVAQILSVCFGSAILLLLSIRFLNYSLKKCKYFILKYKGGANFTEIQNLNTRQEEENPYAEVEAAMKEQALKEIKAMQDAEEKKMSFNQPSFEKTQNEANDEKANKKNEVNVEVLK